MLVYLRDIDCEVHLIFNLVLAISSQSHQISPTALALQHIAYGLFVQLALSQHANDQCSLLDQANGTMFQLTRSVCFRVDIADFFQLQAAFQADCIVDTTTNKEHIMSVGVLCREPLNTLFVFQNLLYLLRDSLQFRNIIAVLLIRDFASDLRKLHCQAVHSGKLCTVCLCRSNRDFRSSKCVEHFIRFTRDAAAHHINDCHCGDTLLFCKTQCCQCIRCLTRLANNDHQCLLIERHLTVAEFRCKFHTYRNVCHIFQHILSSHANVPCRTAGYNIYLLEVLDFVLNDLHARQVYNAILDYRIKGILNSLRLLMNLFHHEMLKAALFSRFCIPLNLGGLLFDFITIKIIKMSLTRSQFCKLKIADVIYITSIFQNRRDIRSHIGFTIRNADDHRTVLTSHPDFAWIITEHQLKGIGTTDTNHRLGNSIDRAKVVLFIIVINQFNNYFRIGLAVERIAMFQQLFFQLGIVLDDTVMYANDLRLHCTRTRTGTVT